MAVKKRKVKELLYQRIVRRIESQINNEVLKVGDRLLSIRAICRQDGVSMSTAQLAYHELEKKTLIESRPQSGYFVSDTFRRKLAIPSSSRPANKHFTVTYTQLFENDYHRDSGGDILYFSRGLPSPELLPVASLNKFVVKALRETPGSGTFLDAPEGNELLRRQVAKWSYSWKGNLASSEIISTSGCMNAISLGMMTLARPGDSIAVESPCFYGILELARSLGLKVLELPTSPQTGVDMDALKKMLSSKKIALALFVSNFSNPLGSLMPDEHKQEAARLLERYNVPLIEDDLYGDVYFGEQRPTCCKTYDEAGMILYCSSVSKTLAPGYRVGWIAPGKYLDKVSALKAGQTISGTTLTHQAVASFLESGRYENHLRKLRRTLYNNYLQYVRVISECFPEGTRISRPQGGLSLWVELPASVDSVEIYNVAIKSRVSLSPGRLFTLQKQFGHCMRLAFGMPWNDKVENGLRLIGRLAKNAV